MCNTLALAVELVIGMFSAPVRELNTGNRSAGHGILLLLVALLLLLLLLIVRTFVFRE